MEKKIKVKKTVKRDTKIVTEKVKKPKSSPWKSMDTVPKDGTRVLLRRQGEVYVGYYGKYYTYYTKWIVYGLRMASRNIVESMFECWAEIPEFKGEI